MTETTTTSNGAKADPSPTSTTSKRRTRNAYRATVPLTSAADVEDSTVRRRTCQNPQSWQSIKNGQCFSRNQDGSFASMKVNCSKAYGIDSGETQEWTEEQQLSQRVYRVWLSTF
jgi:hypothetical protein